MHLTLRRWLGCKPMGYLPMMLRRACLTGIGFLA